MLTEALVRKMRSRAERGTSVAELARQAKVHYLTALRAVNGTTWQHVV